MVTVGAVSGFLRVASSLTQNVRVLPIDCLSTRLGRLSSRSIAAGVGRLSNWLISCRSSDVRYRGLLIVVTADVLILVIDSHVVVVAGSYLVG